jgi:cob(I)alamin adenosyltransferase
VPRERFYTTKGDDGTTGLFGGGRVRKDDPAPEAYGTVDEAQAMIGLARAAVERGTELDELLVAVERDLWVLMAELATAPENRHKLQPGQSLVTDDMVDRIEAATDAISTRFAIPEGGFAVPGQDPLSARLEVARTVVRRAERRTLAVAVEGSHTIPYLNRLSSLLWALARWQEEETLPTKES